MARIGTMPSNRTSRERRKRPVIYLRLLSGFLHRLHGEIAGRVDNHRALAAHPGDNGRPVFVVMPPTRLALLAAPTRAAAQGFLPALLGLALLPRGVIEVIRFHGAFELAMHLIGQRSIAQPPAPPIARTAMHPQLSRHTARRARKAQQEGGENPVWQRALALMEQRIGEVVEGAPTAVAPVAFTPRSVVVRPPRIDVLTLAPGVLSTIMWPK